MFNHFQRSIEMKSKRQSCFAIKSYMLLLVSKHKEDIMVKVDWFRVLIAELALALTSLQLSRAVKRHGWLITKALLNWVFLLSLKKGFVQWVFQLLQMKTKWHLCRVHPAFRSWRQPALLDFLTDVAHLRLKLCFSAFSNTSATDDKKQLFFEWNSKNLHTYRLLHCMFKLSTCQGNQWIFNPAASG